MSCDDGDIITTDVDLSDISLNACNIIFNGTNYSYVFYKINPDTNEGLVFTLTTTDNLLTPGATYGPYGLSAANVFEYRTFNSTPENNYFCSTIPPSSPRVNDVFVATSGMFSIATSVSIEDDDDGILSSIEGDNSMDKDSDGIPDFKDLDDDGDNVPTAEEGVVVVDGVIDLINSLDTDNDGILNYLDDDDDGDGIPTKQEDLNRDRSPQNDFAFNQELPNYLLVNIAIEASPLINDRIQHTFERINSITITAENLVVSNTAESIINGSYVFGIFLTPVETIIAD